MCVVIKWNSKGGGGGMVGKGVGETWKSYEGVERDAKAWERVGR